MPKETVIQVHNTILRTLTRDDIEPLRLLRNKNRQFFLSQQLIQPEQQAAWFCNYETKQNDYMFALEVTAAPGVFAGAAALYSIDFAAGTAESGRLLVDKAVAPSKGVGTSAIIGLCRFGFQTLGLQEIYAEILQDNIASIRAHEKAGYLRKTEQTENIILYSITAERYQKLFADDIN